LLGTTQNIKSMPRAKSAPKKNASSRTTYRRKSYGGGSSYARSYPRRRYSTGYRRYSAPTEFPQFALAQINPFDPKVRGVRVPDESTAPSSPFKLFDTFTIAGATGGTPVINEAALSLFFPNAKTFRVGQAAASNSTTSITYGTTWGASDTATSKSAAVIAQYSVARPVSHGIRITSPLAPTTATGYCHVALITVDTFGASGINPDQLATDGKLPRTVADMRELPHYRRVTIASLTQEPLTVVNKFLDTTAFRYIDVASSELIGATGGQTQGTFHVPQSWMAIVVMVESHNQAAGTGVVNVENICHFEGQAKVAGLNTDDSAETANPDVFDSTSSAAGKTSASYLESEKSMVTAVFFNEVSKWFALFGRSALSYSARGAARAFVGGMYGMYQRARGIPGVNDQRLNQQG